MKRVIVYIDGFNLYHAIDDLKIPIFKWLNLWSLSESFLRSDEQLNDVQYFSAYATWLPDAYQTHRTYIKALQSYNVTVILSKFKNKNRKCRQCHTMWTEHEEKETDVSIAVNLVADAFLDKYDRAILISADSDLNPALKTIEKYMPHKEVFVVSPPKRFNKALALNPKLEMTKGRIAKNLLPENIFNKNGHVIVKRPLEYV